MRVHRLVLLLQQLLQPALEALVLALQLFVLQLQVLQLLGGLVVLAGAAGEHHALLELMQGRVRTAHEGLHADHQLLQLVPELDVEGGRVAAVQPPLLAALGVQLLDHVLLRVLVHVLQLLLEQLALGAQLLHLLLGLLQALRLAALTRLVLRKLHVDRRQLQVDGLGRVRLLVEVVLQLQDGLAQFEDQLALGVEVDHGRVADALGALREAERAEGLAEEGSAGADARDHERAAVVADRVLEQLGQLRVLERHVLQGRARALRVREDVDDVAELEQLDVDADRLLEAHAGHLALLVALAASQVHHLEHARDALLLFRAHLDLQAAQPFAQLAPLRELDAQDGVRT